MSRSERRPAPTWATRSGRTLYEILIPYAELVVCHQHLRVVLGPVEYPLARLAATSGERERATAHFEAALESSRRMGARPYLARAQLEYARMLLGAEPVRSDDLQRARELLADAKATARELGMRELLERVRKAG